MKIIYLFAILATLYIFSSLPGSSMVVVGLFLLSFVLIAYGVFKNKEHSAENLLIRRRSWFFFWWG